MDGDSLDEGNSYSDTYNLERPNIPQHLTDSNGRRILIENPEIDHLQQISFAYDNVAEFLARDPEMQKTFTMTLAWARSITYPYRTGGFDNSLFDDINTLRRQGCIFVDYCLERFEHKYPLPVLVDDEIGNAMRLVIWIFGDICKRGSFESIVEFAENLNRQGINNQLTRSIEKLNKLGIVFLEKNLAK